MPKVEDVFITSNITVTDAVGISIDVEGVITKTAVTDWGNAGGASVETITGDGSVKWSLSETHSDNHDVMVGLSTSNTDAHHENIAYTWYAYYAVCSIWESGEMISSHGPSSGAPVFEIRRTGTTLEYLKNGTVVRTVLDVTTEPLLVDFAMYGTDTKIKSLEITSAIDEEFIYMADVVSQSDYYPFGMLLPNRHEEAPEYRYGFNGMEKDDEVTEQSGTSYDFCARFYNPRVGRWLSTDAMEASYPIVSTYNAFGNSPLIFLDPDGNYIILVHVANKGTVTRQKITKENINEIEDQAMRENLQGMLLSASGKEMFDEYSESNTTNVYLASGKTYNAYGITGKILVDENGTISYENPELEGLETFANIKNAIVEEDLADENFVIFMDKFAKFYTDKPSGMYGVDIPLTGKSYTYTMSLIHEFVHVKLGVEKLDHVNMGEYPIDGKHLIEEGGQIHKAYQELSEGYKQAAENFSGKG